jgi:hypothetical protein
MNATRQKLFPRSKMKTNPSQINSSSDQTEEISTSKRYFKKRADKIFHFDSHKVTAVKIGFSSIKSNIRPEHRYFFIWKSRNQYFILTSSKESKKLMRKIAKKIKNIFNCPMLRLQYYCFLRNRYLSGKHFSFSTQKPEKLNIWTI